MLAEAQLRAKVQLRVLAGLVAGHEEECTRKFMSCNLLELVLFGSCNDMFDLP
jgi:hypothetical protein